MAQDVFGQKVQVGCLAYNSQPSPGCWLGLLLRHVLPQTMSIFAEPVGQQSACAECKLSISHIGVASVLPHTWQRHVV